MTIGVNYDEVREYVLSRDRFKFKKVAEQDGAGAFFDTSTVLPDKFHRFLRMSRTDGTPRLKMESGIVLSVKQEDGRAVVMLKDERGRESELSIKSDDMVVVELREDMPLDGKPVFHYHLPDQSLADDIVPYFLEHDRITDLKMVSRIFIACVVRLDNYKYRVKKTGELVAVVWKESATNDEKEKLISNVHPKHKMEVVKHIVDEFMEEESDAGN